MNFDSRGCKLIGIFDKNEKVNGEVIVDIAISNTSELAEFCTKNKPEIAILCIPKASAQELADKLVNMGIKAFWNFSHYDLRVSCQGVVVENVHLGDSLLTLTYSINNIDK